MIVGVPPESEPWLDLGGPCRGQIRRTMDDGVHPRLDDWVRGEGGATGDCCLVERLNEVNVDFVEEAEDDEEPGSYHDWKSNPVGDCTWWPNHHRWGTFATLMTTFSQLFLMFWTADADNSFCGRGGGPINSISKLPSIRRPGACLCHGPQGGLREIVQSPHWR